VIDVGGDKLAIGHPSVFAETVEKSGGIRASRKTDEK
jgi:hypothetical protein